MSASVVTSVAHAFPSSGDPSVARAPDGPVDGHRLLDLLQDGFYMVFLLRQGRSPSDAETFRARIREFLDTFDREARRSGASPEDVADARFAFCALVDEVVLTSARGLRESWGRRPLQLELFGEQLAGERFFELLERLRAHGAPKIPVLEVLHLCLVLGFEGRYRFEGPEKLGDLIARLGDEIARPKGRRTPFAPHAAAPDRPVHPLRRDWPAWAIAAVFAVFGAIAFAGLRTTLDRQVHDGLAPYSQVVRLAPPPAWFTLTLP